MTSIFLEFTLHTYHNNTDYYQCNLPRISIVSMHTIYAITIIACCHNTHLSTYMYFVDLSSTHDIICHTLFTQTFIHSFVLTHIIYPSLEFLCSATYFYLVSFTDTSVDFPSVPFYTYFCRLSVCSLIPLLFWLNLVVFTFYFLKHRYSAIYSEVIR